MSCADRSTHYICPRFGNGAHARVAQLVEHDLAKVGVAGSSPVSRSKDASPREASSFSTSSSHG